MIHEIGLAFREVLLPTLLRAVPVEHLIARLRRGVELSQGDPRTGAAFLQAHGHFTPDSRAVTMIEGESDSHQAFLVVCGSLRLTPPPLCRNE